MAQKKKWTASAKFEIVLLALKGPSVYVDSVLGQHQFPFSLM